jgi:hypothetical protein
MKIFYLFIALCFIFSACTEPNIDISSPTINIQNISPSPVSGLVCGTTEDNVIYIKSTETLTFDFLFEDNKALSQYKIDIHNNFDCHGHRGPMTEDWNLQKIESLTGQTNNVSEPITVPSNVTAGTYHCSILLLDEAGNQAPTIFYTLIIQNSTDTISPTASLTQPSTGSININKGSILNVQGRLMDNANLENGRIELVYFTPSGNQSVAQSLRLDNTVSNTYNYNFNYTIPTSFVSGTYDFEVRAYDGIGNIANDLDFEVLVL